MKQLHALCDASDEIYNKMSATDRFLTILQISLVQKPLPLICGFCIPPPSVLQITSCRTKSTFETGPAWLGFEQSNSKLNCKEHVALKSLLSSIWLESTFETKTRET